jgi:hypothetical protein
VPGRSHGQRLRACNVGVGEYLEMLKSAWKAYLPSAADVGEAGSPEPVVRASADDVYARQWSIATRSYSESTCLILWLEATSIAPTVLGKGGQEQRGA